MADAYDGDGRIPTIHIVAESIPQAFYRAMKAVWKNGLAIRTEYDRKDSRGNYIDPPSRDARVLVEILDPFKEPRFPPVSFCEIGKYIAEIMGVKDHLVVPIDKLKEAVSGELSAHEWPYTYHQRLFEHPVIAGPAINQMEIAVQRISRTPYTRRAVATTSVPTIDPFLKEDMPCLREVQLRCPEDSDGNLVLNMNTVWRSRDLFRAWPDNVIGLTFIQQVLARQIGEQSGRPTRVGSYADYSSSLHIYGQTFNQVGGNAASGLKSFFENFDEETFIARSMTSDVARDMLILPQLEELLDDDQIRQWHFGEKSIDLIKSLIKDLEEEKYMA